MQPRTLTLDLTYDRRHLDSQIVDFVEFLLCDDFHAVDFTKLHDFGQELIFEFFCYESTDSVLEWLGESEEFNKTNLELIAEALGESPEDIESFGKFPAIRKLTEFKTLRESSCFWVKGVDNLADISPYIFHEMRQRQDSYLEG